MRLEPVKELLPPDPQQGAVTAAEGAAMARAVVNLFRRWQLTDADACRLLGGVSTATYSRWKRGEIGRIGIDLAARLSNLLGIHKSLRLIFTEKQRSYAWVRQPNATFDDRSALEIMLAGQLTDLMRVRHYLDAVRG